ncbi:hypothetical protein Pint_30350 [Pistacia integerrima]|uniref:Uncharacterized protein n=2 Tax=Pistacia TaxID=55512 RepID=A0ACC0ZQV5_9ROSI|nr:hypothetical protein Pint_30350 [Pistacia integerrima]KAJ0075365.1 hypothetical protein Patl1_34764 [Pistacia atlantica]
MSILQHAAYPDLDDCTSFFGVYDGHGGKAVSKFCAKYLHQQVLKHEAYSAGDIGTSAQKAFLRLFYLVSSDLKIFYRCLNVVMV